MKFAVETITPAIALEWLEQNPRNRPLNQRHVDKLAREMSSGHWKVNGDAIRFNGSKLLDGQHRLAAIVKSGITIESLVIHDLSDDVFTTIDTGKIRTASDALAMRGEINAHNLTASVRYVEQYKSNRTKFRPLFTTLDIIEMVEKYPHIRKSVQTTKNMQNTPLLSPAVLAACHYLFSELDEEAAEEFVFKLCKGTQLEQKTPLYMLRERLIDNRTSNAKLSHIHIFALCIKAWNCIRENKSPGPNLRWRESGPVPEEFPKIV